MSARAPAIRDEGMTLARAARVAGFGLLLMVLTAPVAELWIYPKLVIAGDVEQTVRNLASHRGLFALALFCYLITFLSDVVVAWALYVLLIPVNRALSLLTAWFRLVYAAIAIFGLLKFATVYRLTRTPHHETAVGSDELRAQVALLLRSFEYEWSLGLVVFGIYLSLLGYLVYRSGYVPKLMGVLLALSGFGYFFTYLGSYLYPKVDPTYLAVTYFGELIFMLWLLIRGGKIQDPTALQRSAPPGDPTGTTTGTA